MGIDGKAPFGQTNRGVQEALPRNLPTPILLIGLPQTGDQPGRGNSQRSGLRQAGVSLVLCRIALEGSPFAEIEGHDFVFFFEINQHEAAAADAGRLRTQNGNREGNGDGRINGVAAGL